MLGVVGRLATAALLGGLFVGAIGVYALDRSATDALSARVEVANAGLAERLAAGLDDRIQRTQATLRFAAHADDVVSMDGTRASVELSAALRIAREYEIVALYTKDGVPVAAAASRYLADPASMPTRKDLADLVAAGPVVGRVSGKVGGRVPALEIGAPVESPPGHLIGVITAQIPLDVIGAFISSYRLGSTGTASLLDEDGVTLLHNDRSRVVGREVVDVRLGKGGHPVTRTAVRNGRNVFLSAAKADIFPGAVVIEQEIEDATLPVNRSRRVLLLIELLTLLAMAGLILAAGHRILSPIHPLTQAVRHLASGDRTARAPAAKRQDEIGVLTDNFNRMAGTMEGLDRAKNEFVANAAHELRTPLTAMAGLAELLASRDDLSPNEMDEICAALGRQGARARILVERMLDLLRIESGSVIATRVPLNVGQTIASALESTPPPADRSLEIDVAPALMVLADPTSLEQVITNLLTNAYRYGGSAISVIGARSGNVVRIMIEDDGPGVSAQAAEHLFEAFNRGTEASGVGSGLGLAIVQRLMHSMGGTVKYEERNPTGSRFTIELLEHRG